MVGDALEGLVRDADLRRVAGHQSGGYIPSVEKPGCRLIPFPEGLAAYFPKVYAHLADTLHVLQADQPDTHLPFPRHSVYPTIAVNFGPQTITLDHTDCSNAPGLPCAITALGDYDPDGGGQLYLWDFQIIIRFPPGATILISSACMRHGNTPISPNERRYSVTQYVPGGLLRWVRYGCRSAKGLSEAQRNRMDGGHEARVEEILGRLSRVADLEADRTFLIAKEKEWISQ